MRIQFIDPGAFRTEMRLEEPLAVSDGAGGFTESWREVASLLAMIEPVSPGAFFGAGQDHETVTHRITMRFRNDVRSGMRLARSGRNFAILNAYDPDETGRYLVCRVKEEGR